jgi:hypothetical protein
MKEDFLAVVAAHEAEAASGTSFLTRPRTFGPVGTARCCGGRRAPPRAAASAARARCAVAVAFDELGEEELDRDHQVLHGRVGFRREQHLGVADVDDRVAQAGVLVDDVRSGLTSSIDNMASPPVFSTLSPPIAANPPNCARSPESRPARGLAGGHRLGTSGSAASSAVAGNAGRAAG